MYMGATQVRTRLLNFYPPMKIAWTLRTIIAPLRMIAGNELVEEIIWNMGEKSKYPARASDKRMLNDIEPDLGTPPGVVTPGFFKGDSESVKLIPLPKSS